MLRGTKVHKVLEEQVHRTVRVNVATRVDQFALRIWNIVLGLRTLRETGLTRELEVWGVLDGQVVTGIIDELIFKPEEIEEEDGKLPAGDGNINSLRRKSSRAHLTRETPKNLLYLSDVKTRSAAGIPKDADSRGALYQLMLYKSLLSDLATDKIPVEMILTRFGLDGDATFSSLFLESISGLDESSEDNESYDGGFGSTPQETSAQDALATLLEHNTLRKLWAFMVKELQITLPSGVDSISPKLRVEYRRSSNGEVMGEKIFRFNEDKLNAWITAQMQWWKGQREAKGVDIEEIDKCQKCEFSEECQWRVRLEQEWRAKRKQKVKIKMAKKGPGGKLVVTDGYY